MRTAKWLLAEWRKPTGASAAGLLAPFRDERRLAVLLSDRL
jgi:hypothetical protein